jgi:FKBP-type peptidyl-prolyl cis-trans isomerase 2
MIRIPSYRNIADKKTEMFEAVKNSNLDAVLSSFDIKAINKDSNSVVIDVTDLYAKDVQSLGLPQSTRTQYKISTMDDTRTFIDTIKSFPINIEVSSLKTYRASDPPGDKSIGSMTIEVHNSMLLLPKVPYKPRFSDDRVGFFGQSQTDYGLDAQKAQVTRYIHRWKLEPKDPAAYKRGELVEPKKQIIYYIDPATPVKWRPYLIEGVKDWNAAFEEAGFKNAITAMEAPKNDPYEFLCGFGALLPKFEENLQGLEIGKTFEFILSAEEGYGEYEEEAIITMQKADFVLDGQDASDMITIGNIIPLQDQNGQTFQGRITAIGEADVTIDMNHPFAGKNLHFSGEIISIRDAHESEITHGHIHHGGDHSHH